MTPSSLWITCGKTPVAPWDKLGKPLGTSPLAIGPVRGCVHRAVRHPVDRAVNALGANAPRRGHRGGPTVNTGRPLDHWGKSTNIDHPVDLLRWGSIHNPQHPPLPPKKTSLITGKQKERSAP